MTATKRKLTLGGKLIIGALSFSLLFGIYWFGFQKEMIFKKKIKQSVDVNQIILPDAPKTSTGGNVEPTSMPSTDLASVNSPKLTFELMAWNSQMGLMFANGGPQTTKGSLMEKHNVNLSLVRQDDCNQMAQNLIKFAKDYKNNPSTASGTNFIAIMGDGAAAWLSGVNKELSKLGEDYKAQIFYSCGRSLGEDQFMAPPTVKENPKNAKGLLCATVIRDGDWNIVVKWAADNDIRVNTDETTYDPEAINFVAANDFVDAAEKYVQGYSESRSVVKVDPKTGKTTKTGEKKTVTVNSVSTWTPADVTVAENKGGLVRIVSTKEYAAQMPNVVIGISKHLQDNRVHIENFILAASEGGDQVKSFEGALTKAGEISAKVYNEKDGAYWVKYYKGVTETDKQGLLVSLGGSRAHNLADNLDLFGMNGGVNVYASVYKVFGDVVVNLYPEYVPNYPTIENVIDLTYISNAKSKSGVVTNADVTTYNTTGEITETISKRGWSIEFQTGSAEFTSSTLSTLDDLYDQLIVASNLTIEVFGHTDNTGTPDGNMELSQKRADAVKKWLQSKSPANFPDKRFVRVEGKGQTDPVADNSTSEGKSKNRRVEIVMGR